MLSGYYGLYSSQKIMYSKLKAEYINKDTVRQLKFTQHYFCLGQYKYTAPQAAKQHCEQFYDIQK